jgi:predicted dienelactone hydrolase
MNKARFFRMVSYGSWAFCLSLMGADNVPISKPVAAIAEPYAADRKLMQTDFVRLQWTDSSRKREIPVKIYFPGEGDGPFPVIIFSHGLGGTREGYEYLGRQWAANGYVVIHLQHIGSDDGTWRGQDRPMQSMRAAANLSNLLDRIKDVHFAIDQLDSLNSGGPLKGKIDAKKIGMAGHSFGAQTTMSVIGQQAGGEIAQKITSSFRDDRIKAAIAMSPAPPLLSANLDAVYDAIHIPIFMMTGTKDDAPIGDAKAADRRVPFDHIKSNAYLMIFSGGDHMTFSGHVRHEPSDDGFQKLIRLGSTAFWDADLKDDPLAKKWLEQGGFKAVLADQGTFEQK